MQNKIDKIINRVGRGKHKFRKTKKKKQKITIMASKSGIDDGKCPNNVNQMTEKLIEMDSPTKSLDLSSESVEVLRERLNVMKRLMAERQNASPKQQRQQQTSIDDILFSKATKHAGIIDGNFLSFALCGTLCVILVVATYAFYSLYNAVLKKFPSHHTEL